MVYPITNKIKYFYCGVILSPNQENGLTELSEILSFHIRTISTERCIKKLGTIPNNKIQKIKKGINEFIEY